MGTGSFSLCAHSYKSRGSPVEFLQRSKVVQTDISFHLSYSDSSAYKPPFDGSKLCAYDQNHKHQSTNTSHCSSSVVGLHRSRAAVLYLPLLLIAHMRRVVKYGKGSWGTWCCRLKLGDISTVSSLL